eukprot:8606654-Pyramimonas_sp.AAC.1
MRIYPHERREAPPPPPPKASPSSHPARLAAALTASFLPSRLRRPSLWFLPASGVPPYLVVFPTSLATCPQLARVIV